MLIHVEQLHNCNIVSAALSANRSADYHYFTTLLLDEIKSLLEEAVISI